MAGDAAAADHHHHLHQHHHQHQHHYHHHHHRHYQVHRHHQIDRNADTFECSDGWADRPDVIRGLEEVAVGEQYITNTGMSNYN